LIAQDVWDLCNNFSSNQDINDRLARSIVHKPLNESRDLWSLNYRMISLLYMQNNKLRIENIENFLSQYGYDKGVYYGV